MKDSESSVDRLTNLARRRRKPWQAETDSQGTFFAPPVTEAVVPPVAPPAPKVEEEVTLDPELTADQAEALRRIEAAYAAGAFYLLTGHAGSGKTYLMQRLTKNMLAKHRRIVLSAPTHKAVTVLARKINEADIQHVPCRTIHSLLSLTPKARTDRLVFERDPDAEPVTADMVVIDECSMVDLELFRNIKRHLPNAFVLFVGDPAQLPPVGEVESQTFATPNRSHLTTIVRQAAGNPILNAAGIIRTSQGGASDWSWLKQAALENGHGVFVPGGAAHRWMRKAFTSPEFEADPDAFRYLAWTNRRVHQINEMIRRWRYGDAVPTPFMPGERALFRAPLIVEESILFGNNEEATVLAIDRSTLSHPIGEAGVVSKWMATIPTWLIRLRNSDGDEKTVHIPADDAEYQKVITRIKDEAALTRIRWKHLHDFQSSVARLQSIYAMTVHTAQGSTHGTTFLDVSDIRRREATNLLEMQQMLYVAATRPSQRLILVGA